MNKERGRGKKVRILKSNTSGTAFLKKGGRKAQDRQKKIKY